jgi:hypothetical protein
MTDRSQSKQSKPWRIHFFQRDKVDDAEQAVPAIELLDSIPAKVAAEIHAVLDAVAAAPPPSFSGGGKWEAMHDDMAGYFEVRVQGGGMNHRLFCVLERDAEDLGGSSIVCIDGRPVAGRVLHDLSVQINELRKYRHPARDRPPRPAPQGGWPNGADGRRPASGPCAGLRRSCSRRGRRMRRRSVRWLRRPTR